MRPHKDHTFLTICQALSQQATCPRLRNGCVIASATQVVVSTGYNGAPRYLPHCDDVGCQMHEGHCVRALHAELNAILQVTTTGASLSRAVLYSLYRPCARCSLAAVQAGIRRVVYVHEYDTDESREFVLDMFGKAGVEVTRWDKS